MFRRKDRKNRQYKNVLITGAGSGFGREFAHIFFLKGSNVVLVDINEESLHETACWITLMFATKHPRCGMPEIRKITCDLSAHDATENLYSTIKAMGISIDCIVNNAGFGMVGPLHENTDHAKTGNMIDLNVRALSLIIEYFLPEMVDNNFGGFLNLASTSAFQGLPLMPFYSATKAYVFIATESLRIKYEKTGVVFTSLCPGPTRTKFWEQSGCDSHKERLFKWMRPKTTKEVARAGYNALIKDKRLVVPGIINRVIAYLSRIDTTGLGVRVAGWLQKK